MNYYKIISLTITTIFVCMFGYYLINYKNYHQEIDLKPAFAKYETDITELKLQLTAAKNEADANKYDYDQDERFINERCLCIPWKNYSDTSTVTRDQICRLGE